MMMAEPDRSEPDQNSPDRLAQDQIVPDQIVQDRAAIRVRLDTPSGQPVPRFVSMKGPKDFCRKGPSLDHDILYTFQRAGLPVMVVAETRDEWRKIRDAAGDECWAYHSRLINLSHLLAERETTLRRSPSTQGAVRGRIGEGVLVRLIRTRGSWALIAADDLRGWAPLGDFWGGYLPDAATRPDRLKP